MLMESLNWTIWVMMKILVDRYKNNMNTSTDNKNRASNFELLRIICMFLVMIIHYVPKRPAVTAIALNNDFYKRIANQNIIKPSTSTKA